MSPLVSLQIQAVSLQIQPVGLSSLQTQTDPLWFTLIRFAFICGLKGVFHGKVLYFLAPGLP